MSVSGTAKQLTQAQPLGESNELELRKAEVTERSGEQISVRLSGADTALPFQQILTGSGPQVGDMVWVLESGSIRLILGKPETVRPTRCSIRRTSNQAITSGQDVAVIWSEAYDNTGPPGSEMWRAATPSRVNINVSGLYLVTWQVRWQFFNADAEYMGAVWHNGNGGLRYAAQGIAKNATNRPISLNGAMLIELGKDDYIELRLFQNTGSNIVIESGWWVPDNSMQVQYVSTNI